MNALDGSPLLYINCKNIDYDTVNSLIAKNFLLN